MDRFGIIGDVHAEDELLEAALLFLAEKRVVGHAHERLATRADQFFAANAGTLRRSDASGFAVLELTEREPVVRSFDLDDDGRITPSGG